MAIISPQLNEDTKKLLNLRKILKSKKPNFLRQEWFRYKRLGKKWRYPKGKHSKLRKHKKYRINVPSIGYSSPKKVRFLHSSGAKEIMVHNINELKNINPETHAIRVGHTVGYKKRLQIQSKAKELNIKILNAVK